MLKPNDPRHGTNNGYSYHGCRCDACRVAANAKRQRVRQQQKGRTDISHGTTNSYTNYGCRCQACRAAWSQYLRTRPSRSTFAQAIREK